MAKELAPKLIEEILGKKYEIKKEFKGSELEGLEYIHPFEGDLREFKELKEKYENVHTVLLSKKHVTLDAGSGFGQYDYYIAKKHKDWKIKAVDVKEEQDSFDSPSFNTPQYSADSSFDILLILLNIASLYN